MSQTIVSVIATLLVTLLPKVGVSVGSEELTTTIQTIVIVVSGIWIWIQRVRLGGVTALGMRK